MSFWKGGVTAALLLCLPFTADDASAFRLPVPPVQAKVKVEQNRDGLVSNDKALLLKASRGTGSLELGEEDEDIEEDLAEERGIDCLATAMYFEARGEPARGQYVVGRVILNRVKSRFYPDTICDVVYQNAHLKNRCQFSFACDGLPNEVKEGEAWEIIRRRAEFLAECDEECMNAPPGASDLWTSTHYHADYVSPSWAKKLHRTGRIGRHIFYYTNTM
jgi:hypothetical protein